MPVGTTAGDGQPKRPEGFPLFESRFVGGFIFRRRVGLERKCVTLLLLNEKKRVIGLSPVVRCASEDTSDDPSTVFVNGRKYPSFSRT